MSEPESKSTSAPKPKKLSVNVTDDLLDQVDAVVEKNGPFCKRHAVHLAALRLGLAELLENPDRVHAALELRPSQLA